MEEFNSIMLDLETMGNRSNSTIVSIAAVPFNMNTGEISNNYFYEIVDLQSCLNIGLKVQSSTILWWMEQSKEARKEICKPGKDISLVLSKLTNFFNDYNEDIEIWGNGVRFDIGLLEDAYYACKYDKLPWNFRYERDVRTLVSFAPHIKEQTPNVGTSHNAYYDCIFQINYCHSTYKYLMEKLQYNNTNKLMKCDICSCHTSTIIVNDNGTFCPKHVQY